MKVAIRRFALPLVAIVGLWILSVLMFGFLAETALGSWESGRVFPFSNAHLLEEAEEGLYAPIQDPVFVLFTIAVAFSAFGVSSFWGALGASRSQLLFVSAAAILGLALHTFHLRSAFSSSSSEPIRSAAIFILSISLLAAVTGIGASRYVRLRRG